MEKATNLVPQASRTRQMVCGAILASVGVLLTMLIHFPIIPAAPFLEVDFGDMPAMIAGFAFSPLLGLITITITAIVQALTVSAASGWIGALMHIAASGTFILVASLIYKRYHSYKGAIVGLIIGSLAATAVMIPLNILLIPLFMGVGRDIVIGMIIPAILPFNLLKFLMNSVLVLALYKPLRSLMLMGKR